MTGTIGCGGADVLTAAASVMDVLQPAVDRDWSLSVPELDFTVASAIAHAASGLLWYAVDVWEGPTDEAAYEVSVRADAENNRLLNSLRAAAAVCAASIDAAPPTTRGFHPAGAADPEGFSAMACDEVLVHGDDAARGLGLPFAPDGDLAERVLLRLFPWHTKDRPEDPWTALLWANGRVTPADRVRQEGWQWHCAPLSEWDGAVPVGA